MTKFGIGQGVARVEDPRLLTGRGRFADDAVPKDALRCHVLRSPHAHARILGIDVEAARSASGVVAVLTGADLVAEGLGGIACEIPLINRDGSARADTPRPALTADVARYVGDPVAAVIAETLDQARDAAELVEVDYEPLPAVVDTVGAAQTGAPRIWPHIENNLVFDWELGDGAAVEAALAAASHEIEVELVNNRIVVASMEPRAATAWIDPEDGRLTLRTGSQGTHYIRDSLAQYVFGLEPAEIRVLSDDVGGGFGMKAFIDPEHVILAWAARKLGRAISWTSERTEAFLSDVQGRDNVTKVTAAVDAEGRIQAVRVATHAALGAYLSPYGPMVPTVGACQMIGGVYAIPTAYVRVQGVMTNTVPIGPYRGAGRPEAAYAMERIVDVVGRTLGLAPDEVRRRNMIPADQIPYATALGYVYDSGRFEEAMDACLARAEWAGFEARRADAAAAGKLRGIGLAYYIERCGGGFPESAELRFEEDDTLTVATGTQRNGQGHETAFKQVLGGRLGIDVERITILQGDSDVVPKGLTGGSRSLPVGGPAMLGAAEKSLEKGRRVAAGLLETAVEDIEYDDGDFVVAGTDRRADLFAVARAARDPAHLAPGEKPGLDAEHTHVPEVNTFPNGCHVVEVEVDPETGEIEILRYTIVDDFGTVINPLLLAGQVHGGTVQGIGQALLEHTAYDEETGQLLAASFMDYALPRADHAPDFDFTTRNEPCTTNPLGLKGAGEAGAIGAPPALVSAVVDALWANTGQAHIDMPITAEKVWRALRVAG